MMATSKILDAADMTAPRTPATFVAWAMQKAEELGATPEAKEYARSGAALPKKFYDEIYPLALFVRRELNDISDALVQPNLSNDNFDASVVFQNPRPKLFIEITRATDGYDESLRDEVLAREGHVSGTGPVTKVSGRKGALNRKVEVQSGMVLVDEVFAKHLALVRDAVRAKARRQYGRHFILLVVVDDYLPFRRESDQAKLHEVVEGTLLSPDLDFGRLVILGISGKLLLPYRLPRYCSADDGTL
jgi:hypothetical protein